MLLYRIMSEDFAYRLQIRIAPHWGVICEKVMPPPTMKDEHAAFLAKLKDSAETDRMLNRTYDFTEFFDSRSGLQDFNSLDGPHGADPLKDPAYHEPQTTPEGSLIKSPGVLRRMRF
jgi:hypothetical protein